MTGPAESLRETDPTQWALRERVKELTCLYGIAQVADKTNLSMDDVMAHVVALLPPAWQYPECTCARILFDDRGISSPAFVAGDQRQIAPLVVEGRTVGQVEIHYKETCPDADEGPFLKEERSLITEVARQVSLILERRLAHEERAKLEQQLQHADRLATIGRLAAGVAHELNEPLGAILGFAQLTQKNFGIPDQTGRDLEKIVQAALRAREIVRKLLIFARQTSAQKVPVDMNQVVREGLYLPAARWAKTGVKIVLDLAPHLPPVEGDPSLLQQVITNLAVNAFQAMPSGGTLRVGTRQEGREVILLVEDSGEGMNEDVRRQVFTPFFTTKDVGQGTGLGLAVVHGIVTGHGGRITLDSAPGKGTRFHIVFPTSAPRAVEVME